MNATQPSRPPLHIAPPAQRSVPRTRRQPQQRHQPHQVVATEVGVKLAVNVVLAIAAVSALVKLIPYNLTQQAKLRELTTEVAAVEGRVDQIQTDFNRHFDPRQATSVMQEQTSRIEPGQRPIVWVDPPSSDSSAQ
ncbi:hypothetical protein H6F88_21015 [Oculatella sp. FACHB-28]|uniref:slr1601 family putative cell division protein n=1 Tax=Cyanophyceae TaxID=3028117 RepID=UPI00168856C3|nr:MULTISPECIES: hypothetical protein [Cyanophyceae]MBD1870701.1 hypothetical protein [Cyanobacteria bacterium FACHB-471]MBD1998699.1 hypothetical protein [Leptolyngbya sp. FACHB-541]MBD2058443.1 hypothetical protein [Oculatella sp. FACHB-28]MBD2071708.1 hypothetical protein [Leptolyngbya sp. FACHB-671]